MLEAGDQSFNVVVVTSASLTGRIESYGVRIFRQDLQLVGITVNTEHEEPRMRSALPAGYAYLHTVNRLPGAKGDLTTSLVKATLRLVRQHCPWVHGFRLNDTSTVFCTSSCTNVPLATLSLCYTGKTWYERAFGAHLEVGHAAYRALIMERMQTPSGKPVFSDFANAHLSPSDPALLTRLRPAYESTTTLQEFFNTLRTSNTTEFCSLIMPWSIHMIDQLLLGAIKGSWIIVEQDCECECEWGDWFHTYERSTMLLPSDLM